MFWWGFVVWFGVMLLMVKMPRRTMLWWLGHDVWADVLVSVLTLVIHWGTFSGVMAATIAGLMTSITTTVAKHWVGYIRAGAYHHGIVSIKLPPMPPPRRSWFSRRSAAS